MEGVRIRRKGTFHRYMLVVSGGLSFVLYCSVYVLQEILYQTFEKEQTTDDRQKFITCLVEAMVPLLVVP